MSFLHSRVSLRRFAVVATLTAALAVPLAMATPATADAPAPGASAGSASIVPAGGYSSIDACSLSFSPSTFSASDTFTVTTTFGSTPGAYRIGADGLGPELASVLAEAVAPLSTANTVTPIPVTSLRANWGLAPGTHSMDFYAVDGTGAAIGTPLCSATYNFVGEPEPFVFAYLGASPLRVGESVPVNGADGAFVYTPTADARLTGCLWRMECAHMKAQRAWDAEEEGRRDITLEPGVTEDGRALMFLLDTGLAFIPNVGAAPEASREFGRLSGTPTLPGTYTLTSLYTYECPSAAAPGSIPTAVTAGVDQQTYAGTGTFTFVVEAAPVFTG